MNNILMLNGRRFESVLTLMSRFLGKPVDLAVSLDMARDLMVRPQDYKFVVAEPVAFDNPDLKSRKGFSNFLSGDIRGERELPVVIYSTQNLDYLQRVFGLIKGEHYDVYVENLIGRNPYPEKLRLALMGMRR